MRATAVESRRRGPRVGEVEPTLRYRVMWWANRILMRLLFRIRVEGLDNLPEPPYLIVSNHHNTFDPMLMMAVTPAEPRIVFFGPKEADFTRGFKNRVMGFVGSTIPYHPNKTNLAKAWRTVHRVFNQRGVLAIFAEGQVGFRESELLPFEEGAAAFAHASKVPVVPCAVIGSVVLWLRRPIVIKFGPVLRQEGLPSGREGRAALETKIRDAVQELLPQKEPVLPRRRPLAWLLTKMLK
jgi:1-acyl-sn-glycerol-3-phosphate acyltransferase